jgi:hypothetical protein
MNREVCLVICFFVGVLIFYLLKQNCGCDTVVEGSGPVDFMLGGVSDLVSTVGKAKNTGVKVITTVAPVVASGATNLAHTGLAGAGGSHLIGLVGAGADKLASAVTPLGPTRTGGGSATGQQWVQRATQNVDTQVSNPMGCCIRRSLV